MQNISQEYLLLFNAITDAEASLNQLRSRLIAAQQQAFAAEACAEGVVGQRRAVVGGVAGAAEGEGAGQAAAEGAAEAAGEAGEGEG